jgi:IS30 family transposase
MVRVVAPDVFWVELRAGATMMLASHAVGVSHFTGYRWLAEVGGPAALGLSRVGAAAGDGRCWGGRPWGGRLGGEVRDRFWAELRLGSTVPAAARAAGVSISTGRAWLVEAGGVRLRVVNAALEAAVTAGCGVLSFVDRCRIEDLTRAGYTPARVAGLLGRPRSTITRELTRGHGDGQSGGQSGGQGRYRAVIAQAWVDRNRRRAGRPPKLVVGSRLFDEVVERLSKRNSPEQVSGRLKRDFPDDPEMWVSPETIYQALYVRPKSELAKQVKEALRTGRTRRKAQGRQSQPKLKGMINISERPAEAIDRAVPGHWEGDLILGAHCQSAIGTLAERTTGFVLLLHLPGDHTAATVADAMTAAVTRLPEQLRRSMTWDQGSEMALHTKITTETGMPIYFCDPHSPWQRGTNENTNGLLRQYFPKSTDLSFYGPGLLDQVAAELNARPRKRLNYETPAEAIERLLSNPTESVASTA